MKKILSEGESSARIFFSHLFQTFSSKIKPSSLMELTSPSVALDESTWNSFEHVALHPVALEDRDQHP